MTGEIVAENHISIELYEQIKRFKQDMHRFYEEIGAEQTPEVDAQGRRIIDKRPDGKDYIVEAYMRKKLDRYFPGWSLEMAAPLQFLGAEWVVAQVVLVIPDERLLAFRIVPPVRRFYGVDSVRIQYKRDMPHTMENIIDIGDNCKQAVSAAFKFAINRLTNIGDDVYGKRMDLEGAGTVEEVIMQSDNEDLARTQTLQYISKRGILTSKVFATLGVSNYGEVTDWKEAYKILKEKYG